MIPVNTANAVTAQDAAHNPLVALVAEGQSIWLDYITRELVRGGELKRMIEHDGLRGMTSNPTIFHKAITAGHDYDDQIDELLGQGNDADAIFEALAVRDIRDACDIFRPLYDQTNGADGYVSIEVAPRLAHDTQGTLLAARRLWQQLPAVVRSRARTESMALAPDSSIRAAMLRASRRRTVMRRESAAPGPA